MTIARVCDNSAHTRTQCQRPSAHERERERDSIILAHLIRARAMEWRRMASTIAHDAIYALGVRRPAHIPGGDYDLENGWKLFVIRNSIWLRWLCGWCVGPCATSQFIIADITAAAAARPSTQCLRACVRSSRSIQLIHIHSERTRRRGTSFIQF